MKRVLVVTLLASLLVPSISLAVAAGKFTRGDLARSLRRFESAWEERRADLRDDERKRVTGLVTKATFGFFTNDFEGASGELLRATSVLRGTNPVHEGLSVTAPALLDAKTTSVPVILARPRGLVGEPVEATIALLGPDGSALGSTRILIGAAMQLDGRIEASNVTPGRATIVLRVGEREHERRSLSFVSDLAARLAKLDAAVATLAGPRVASLRARRAQLERALSPAQDDGVDRDHGAALELLERDVAALAKGEDPFPQRACDELRDARGVVYRLVVSDAVVSAGPKKAPLVIALHGAGGDEDMFVEAYGRGIIARLARESGAILACPRSPAGFSGEHVMAVVDEVARDYDVSGVFLVGHSMGSSQALDALVKHPDRFEAAALFAGPVGPRLTPKKPVYVAVGSADVARAGAKAFADANPAVRYDERKGLEHLLIVREAAEDAFAFLRQHGLGRKRYY